MESMDSDCGFSIIQKPNHSMSTFGKSPPSNSTNWEALLDIQRANAKLPPKPPTRVVTANNVNEAPGKRDPSPVHQPYSSDPSESQRELNSQLSLANARLWEVNRNLLRDLTSERDRTASLQTELRKLKNQLDEISLEKSFSGHISHTASPVIGRKVSSEANRSMAPNIGAAKSDSSKDHQKLLEFAFSELKRCRAQMSEMNQILSKRPIPKIQENTLIAADGFAQISTVIPRMEDLNIRDGRSYPQRQCSESSSEPFPSPPAPLNPEVTVLEEPWEEFRKTLEPRKYSNPDAASDGTIPKKDNFNSLYGDKVNPESLANSYDQFNSSASKARTSFTSISTSAPRSDLSLPASIPKNPRQENTVSNAGEDMIITVKLSEKKPIQSLSHDSDNTKDRVMFVDSKSVSERCTEKLPEIQGESSTGQKTDDNPPIKDGQVPESTIPGTRSPRRVSETDYDCHSPPTDYDVIAHDRQCPICGRDFQIFDCRTQAKFEAHADYCADEILGEEPRTIVSRYEYGPSTNPLTKNSFPVRNDSGLPEFMEQATALSLSSSRWTCPVCASTFPLLEMSSAQFECHVRCHFGSPYSSQ